MGLIDRLRVVVHSRLDFNQLISYLLTMSHLYGRDIILLHNVLKSDLREKFKFANKNI